MNSAYLHVAKLHGDMMVLLSFKVLKTVSLDFADKLGRLSVGCSEERNVFSCVIQMKAMC